MKQNSRDYLTRLAKQDMSLEYRAVNGLQNTPWTIDTKVLQVMRQAWDSGQEWAGLPPRFDLDLPTYPFNKDPQDLNEEEQKLYKDWAKQRSQIYTYNGKSMSRRIQVERTLQIAEQYAKHPEFYFVWQLDFRSRKYPVESFMQPQVADWGKALLLFNNGFPNHNEDDAA